MKRLRSTLHLILIFTALGCVPATSQSLDDTTTPASSGLSTRPSPLDKLKASVNPSGTDYGAVLDQNLHQAERNTLDSLYFWLFVICGSAVAVLFVWVVLLEKQKARRLEITKLIVRQSWIAMRVFATLWKESDNALRERRPLLIQEPLVQPPQPFPTAVPTYRVTSQDASAVGAENLSNQVERQQAELIQLHKLLQERDSRIEELSNAVVPKIETSAERVLLRQLEALQAVAEELRNENDELAKENATQRSGGTVSNAMAALTKRYESLRVSRNKLQVDMTALRLELAEQANAYQERTNEGL